MNRLMGMCVLVTTAISIITHRKEIKEVWDDLVAMLPYPPAPVVNVHIDGRALREVMDITRDPRTLRS